MDKLNPELRENMEYVARILRTMGCRVHPADSTSVLFAKLPKGMARYQNAFTSGIGRVLGGKPHHRKSITELMQDPDVNIGFIDGEKYGTPGYIRVNLGCPFPRLKMKYDLLLEKWGKQA
jgi:bifunctional pyridoxal-dependent enzyme with beta-cystathionase and maltose regulon repressor activities